MIAYEGVDFSFFFFLLHEKQTPPEGGGGGRKFWIKPLKETDLGVAQPIEAILNFDYLNRVNKTNWKYMSFYIS